MAVGQTVGKPTRMHAADLVLSLMYTGVSKGTLQWYSKCYCVEWYENVYTPLSINTFITLTT
jgi:hypothetical protein